MAFTRGDLADLDKLWKEAASSPAADVGDVPEGKYQAKITKAELCKSSSGRPQCCFSYKVVGGASDCIGKEATTYDGLETAQNMTFFIKKLRRLRLVPASAERVPFEDVPGLLKRAVGSVVEVQVKAKDDFVNVYINKLVKAADEEAATSEAEEEEEEEETTAEEAEETEEAETEKKPAKAAKRDAAEDEDEDGDEDGDEDEKGGESEEDEEGEGEDEKEEEAKGRNLPSQSEIDKMKPAAVTKLLSAEFGIKADPEKWKETTLRGVSKALVAIMEDDEYDAPEKDLEKAAKLLGLKPAEGKKKLLRQIIAKLSE